MTSPKFFPNRDMSSEHQAVLQMIIHHMEGATLQPAQLNALCGLKDETHWSFAFDASVKMAQRGYEVLHQTNINMLHYQEDPAEINAHLYGAFKNRRSKRHIPRDLDQRLTKFNHAAQKQNVTHICDLTTIDLMSRLLDNKFLICAGLNLMRLRGEEGSKRSFLLLHKITEHAVHLHDPGGTFPHGGTIGQQADMTVSHSDFLQSLRANDPNYQLEVTAYRWAP